MSGDVVNLNKARKARIRAESSAKAVTNRAIFGRSKTERSRAEAAIDKAARNLDGHRLDPASKT